MNQHKEYLDLLDKGQKGRLYFFEHRIYGGYSRELNPLYIFVIPDGEEVRLRLNEFPTSPDYVLVYGELPRIKGKAGGFGWLHDGPWKADVENLLAIKKLEKQEKERLEKEQQDNREKEKSDHIKTLLSTYKGSV